MQTAKGIQLFANFRQSAFRERGHAILLPLCRREPSTVSRRN
jgi:hypothetical protein